MKKIFTMAVAAISALTMNAETLFSYTAAGPTSTETSKVEFTCTGGSVIVGNASKMEASTIAEGGFAVKLDGDASATNTKYVLVKPTAQVAAGSTVKVSMYCTSDPANKVQGVKLSVGRDGADLLATLSSTKKNAVETMEYIAAAAVDSFYITRNTNSTYFVAVTIETTDGPVVIKPATPTFSVKAGTYYEAFKVGIASTSADKIMVSVNGATYTEYTDSIDVPFKATTELAAYAVKGELNSDTATVKYITEQFIAREIYKARTIYEFANIKSEDLQYPADMADLGTYNMDGVDIPALTYKNMKTAEQKDSVLEVRLKSQPGIVLAYKNGSNKSNIYKFANDYVQVDGYNGMIYLENLTPGDTIVFAVTAKGTTYPVFSVEDWSTTCYLDVADDNYGYVFTESSASVENDYEGYTNLVYTVQAGRHNAKIKETAGGFRIAKIYVGAYRGEKAPEGIFNSEVEAVKAEKAIINGQLVIIKNGVRYPVMGARL